MKNTLAILITVAALLVGGWLAGYGWSEWLQPRPPVDVEGWLVVTVDEMVSQRVLRYTTRELFAGQRAETIGDWEAINGRRVTAVDKWRPDWRHVGTITFDFHSFRVPGRIDELSVADLMRSAPPAVSLTYRLYVEPEVLPEGGEGLFFIRKKARYLVSPIEFGGNGARSYEFPADNGSDAMTLGTDLAWTTGVALRESKLQAWRAGK